MEATNLCEWASGFAGANERGAGGRSPPCSIGGRVVPPDIMIRVAVPKEISQGEKRVALVPEVAGRLVKAGFEIHVESGAGIKAHFPDEQYTNVGAKIIKDTSELYNGAQIILKVQAPKMEEIDFFPEGALF